MFSLSQIRECIAAHDPELLSVEGKKQAAVAIVLRSGAAAPELLFIERAHREGDPWSGHMAFPGGRLEAEDATPRHAAERETFEEVGVSLEGADYLGRIADLAGRPESHSSDLVVSAHVFVAQEVGEMVLNHEVQAAFWFPLSDLHDDVRHVEHPYSVGTASVLPGIVVGEPESHIVWGLTYRFLELFFHAVETPLPERWEGM